MIVRETDPGMIYSRKVIELTDKECNRIRDVIKEIKSTLNATSVRFDYPLTIGAKTDYEIQISHADKITADETKKFIIKICDELRTIFLAETYAMSLDEMYDSKADYTIKFLDGYANGYIF